MSELLISWDAPGPYVVAFTTRRGGVSEGPYRSLNLGFRTEDDAAKVEENRRRVYAAVGADAARVTWPRQVHGGRVVRASETREEGDAIWTDAPGRPLTIVTADCVPVALASRGERAAVALAHVGWRGLLAGLVPAAVEAVGRRVVAAVGPAIGPCCYEVRDDVAAPVRAAFGSALVRNGRLDLPGAVERALRGAGCARVDRLDACTSCDAARFFSHRRDAGRTGRQGAIAYVA